MLDNSEFNFDYKVFYELVGKEKLQGQILCYFVFYADYIEGVGTKK